MIPAFIVLTVIACGMGGFMAFTIIRDKKKAKVEDAVADGDEFEPKAEVVNDNSGGEMKAVHKAEEESAATVAEREIAAEAVATLPPQNELAETDDSEDDEITEVKSVVENGVTRYIVVKYSKSFLAKLIQSGEQEKRYYSEIKNALLSYNGIKSRVSWKWETFRSGKKTLAKFVMRGKAISVAFALDPDKFEGSEYHIENLVDVKAFSDTPCVYRINNDRRLDYCKELIAKLMEYNGVTVGKPQTVDYVAEYPYENTETLIGKNHIKVLTDETTQSGMAFKLQASVTVQEADALMRDEVATMLIVNGDKSSDKTTQGTVSIDTLSEHFENGETVTLDEIKKRVKGFNQKTTYVKVLARGMLDKPLTVEADAFSLQAVKMIVLTGGKAIKKR